MRVAAARPLGDVHVFPCAAAAEARVFGFWREPGEELALFIHVHDLDRLALRAGHRDLRSRLQPFRLLTAGDRNRKLPVLRPSSGVHLKRQEAKRCRKRAD